MSNRIRHRNHFWQEFEQSQIVVIDPSPYLLFWIGAGWNRDRFDVHMSFKLIRAPEIKRHEMWSMCSIAIFVCDNRKPVECRQSSVYTRPFAVWLSCSVRCRETRACIEHSHVTMKHAWLKIDTIIEAKWFRCFQFKRSELGMTLFQFEANLQSKIHRNGVISWCIVCLHIIYNWTGLFPSAKLFLRLELLSLSI